MVSNCSNYTSISGASSLGAETKRSSTDDERDDGTAHRLDDTFQSNARPKNENISQEDETEGGASSKSVMDSISSLFGTSLGSKTKRFSTVESSTDDKPIDDTARPVEHEF